MNIPKILARAGVFIIALVSAIALTKFYMRPAAAPRQTPTATVARQSPPETAPPETPVHIKARLVTLDFERRNSYTTLVLERDRQQPAPEKLWVRTYFFTPDSATTSKLWTSDPVEIRQPFATGDKVTINAVAACFWCDDGGASMSGYYARVYLSTASPEAASVREEQLSYDITTAIPVVVEAAAKHSR